MQLQQKLKNWKQTWSSHLWTECLILSKICIPFVDRVPDTKQNMYEANEVWSSLKKLAKYNNAKQQINTTATKYLCMVSSELNEIMLQDLIPQRKFTETEIKWSVVSRDLHNSTVRTVTLEKRIRMYDSMSWDSIILLTRAACSFTATKSDTVKVVVSDRKGRPQIFATGASQVTCLSSING